VRVGAALGKAAAAGRAAAAFSLAFLP